MMLYCMFKCSRCKRYCTVSVVRERGRSRLFYFLFELFFLELSIQQGYYWMTLVNEVLKIGVKQRPLTFLLFRVLPKPTKLRIIQHSTSIIKEQYYIL